MKRITYIFFAVMTATLTTACSEKKKSNIIIAPKPVVKVQKNIQKMSNYEQARDIEWLGTTYKVVVKRVSDSNLPLLTLDENNKYYDNKITIRIIRSDGSDFFNHTFTKEAFENFIDDHTKKAGALLGIVYVKSEGDNLYFAASVGSPDVTSDEYVPMVLKISRMGAVSISKDQILDTDSNEGATTDKKQQSSSSEEDEDEGV